MAQRILVSKRIIVSILSIGERQLSNLVKDGVAIKVEDRYDLILTVKNYLNCKGTVSSYGLEEVDAITLGNLFGVSDRTIRELAQKDILKKSENGSYLKDECIKNYIEYLTEKMDKNSLAREEELKRKTADRQLKELKLQEQAKELHRTETVAKAITNMITVFKTKALTLPSKLAGRVTIENDIKVVEQILKDGVYELLRELSEWRIEDDGTNQ